MVQPSATGRNASRYKAFISYSHTADAQLAPALRSALRRIGQPWYRRASFRIFLDNSSLSANPALWTAIESALAQSEYLLLLASTSSAKSEWVKREIDWWLTNRGPATLLILVTDGDVNWRQGDRDFDWDQSTALNPRLRGQFTDEPLWVDLRWTRAEPNFSLRHPRFRNAILQIAPPLYGKSREDLDDDDTRHYRTARRMALAGILLLAVLGLGVTYWARKAHNEQLVAECRQLAGQATGLLDTRLDQALLLGVENSRSSGCIEGANALLIGLQHRPHLSAFLSAHTDMVTDLAYSPDGHILASSGWDRTVRFWDMQKRRPMGPVLKGSYGLSFSPDGSLLASADVDSVNLWNVPSGTLAGKLSVAKRNELSRVSFSPNGKLLAASSEAFGGNPSKVYLWDVATRQALGPPIEAKIFAFSPNGKTLATEGADGKSIVLRDIVTRRLLRPPLAGHTARVRSIAFRGDGQMLAVGSEDNSIIVWDLADRRAPGNSLVGHRGPVNAVAFSPDGNELASGSGDGSVILWDLNHLQPMGAPFTVAEKPVFAVAFSPDGRTVVSNSEERVVMWSVGESGTLGRELPRPKNAKSGLTFSPDGKTLASLDQYGQVTLSDAETGRTRVDSIGERGTSLAFSPNGAMFATVNWKGVLAFWDSATGEPQGAPQQTQFGLFSVAFSPDGRTLAIGGDAVVLLWDIEQRRWIAQIVRQQKDRVWSVAFSPDGKLLASGGNASFALWDARTGSPVLPPMITNPKPDYLVPTNVVFSHDGKLLAARTDDARITLWDVARRRQRVSALSGHKGPVSLLAFSADDRLLVSGADDGKVILWDVQTRQQLGLPLMGMGDEVQSLTFHPKTGALIAMGDKRLLHWDLNVASWRESACRIANRSLTHEEWTRFFGPRLLYRETCPMQPATLVR